MFPALASLNATLKTPQLVLAIVVAVAMLVIVVELIRRKKLREEYSLLWIATAIILMALALETRILEWLMRVMQAESAVSILYFGALVFLMLVALQFSVRLTKLSFQSKRTAQRIALLEAEIEDLRHQLQPPAVTATPAETADAAAATTTVTTTTTKAGKDEKTVRLPRPSTTPATPATPVTPASIASAASSSAALPTQDMERETETTRDPLA